MALALVLALRTRTKNVLGLPGAPGKRIRKPGSSGLVVPASFTAPLLVRLAAEVPEAKGLTLLAEISGETNSKLGSIASAVLLSLRASS